MQRPRCFQVTCSVKCSHCSWRWFLLSNIALLAWAVASVALIYSHLLGEELIIQVKHSFGAAIFINTSYIKFHYLWVQWKWSVFRDASAASPTWEGKRNHSAPRLLLLLSTLLLAGSPCRGQVISQEVSKGYDIRNQLDNYLNNSQTEMLEFKLTFSLY